MTDNSTPTTTPDLGAIRERLDRLNTTPWRYVSLQRDELGLVVDTEDHSIIIYDADEAEPNCIAALDQFDAEFIAAAPADIRYLLRRIAELEAERNMAINAQHAFSEVATQTDVFYARAVEERDALAARIQALEDALRDIGENYPPAVPDDQLDAVLATLAGVRRVARAALEGNK